MLRSNTNQPMFLLFPNDGALEILSPPFCSGKAFPLGERVCNPLHIGQIHHSYICGLQIHTPNWCHPEICYEMNHKV